MLRLEGVHSYYGNSHVLREVSLEVREGELVGVLGLNGAGKTTLISSIVGFVKARRGQILFNGVNISALSVERRAQLGISLVPQGRRIFPLLTVEENLIIGSRRVQGGWTLHRLFSLFPRLKERRMSLGSHLSGGEQQMLAIGRALMMNPSLLLLDEPSEGLAPQVVDELYGVMAQLRSERLSILLIEHSLEAAVALADRIYILKKGAVVFETADAESLTDAVCQKWLSLG
jgi:branched-chain amino acid transport system ATP-binding protein